MTRHLFVFVVLIGFALSTSAQAQWTWYVDDDNCPGGTGTPEDPFCTVQQAVDVAADGDIVEVAPGVYEDGIDIDNLNITIISTDGPYLTGLGPATGNPGLLDTVVAIEYCAGAGVRVEGFTIRNGRGHQDSGFAGGVEIFNSTAVLENDIIQDNSVFNAGGGIYVCNATDTVRIVNCLITRNQAALVPDFGHGGGLYIENSDVLIRGSTFSDNRARLYGGAILCHGSGSLTIRDSILWGDTADVEGPEIYLWGTAPDGITFSLDYNDLEGGLDAIVFEGIGVYNEPVGNIAEDPEFIHAPAYHVPCCSPVVNAGTPDVIPIDETDIDGQFRVMDGRYDMGADEVDLSLIIDGDFDDDGVVDLLDFLKFASCFTGPCGDPPCYPPLYEGCCTIGDFEDDGDVDLADFATFQLVFEGGD